MSDIHLIRFKDGPLAGKTLMPKTTVFGWPLPERFHTLSHLDQVANVACWAEGEDGDLPPEITQSPNVVVYRKIRQSELPDDSMSHVARGAEYEVDNATIT